MCPTKEELNKALAINGGEKTIKKPFPPRGHFGQEEKEAANRVMDNAIKGGVAPGYGGAEEAAYCKEFSEMMGGGFADAVNSGTTAVFVALRALDIEPFSEVIVGPITDPGGIMGIPLMNCIPIIADSAKGSFNTCLEEIKKVVTPRTKAIVVPHIAGEPADIAPIVEFAHTNGIYVVEDCAQAHGAKIGGKLVGTFGDIAAFSLMFGKHTCTGGQGGMVFTKNEALYWKVRQNSDRGKPFGLPKGSSNCVASVNFNLDEMGCAIGRVQLKKMLPIADKRWEIVNKVADGINNVKGISMPPYTPNSQSSCWFLRLSIDFNELTCDKATIVKALVAEGLVASPFYNALPFLGDWCQNKKVFGTSNYPWASPDYKGDRNMTYSLDTLPNAKEAIDNTFMIYPVESWSDEDVNSAIEALVKVFNAFAK